MQEKRGEEMKKLIQRDIDTAATKRQYYERIIAPKKPEVQFLCNGTFPMDRNGTIALPELPRRKLVKMYFDEHNVDAEFLH